MNTACNRLFITKSLIYRFAYLCFIIERKESKGSLTNGDEIAVETQTATDSTVAAAIATSSSTVVPSTVKVTTSVHEENEKTGETNDVSDKKR